MSRLMAVGNLNEDIENNIECEFVETDDIRIAVELIDDFNPNVVVVNYPLKKEEIQNLIDKINDNVKDLCALIIIDENKNYQKKLDKVDIYYVNKDKSNVLIEDFLQPSGRKTQILDKLHVLQALARNMTNSLDMTCKGEDPSGRHLKISDSKKFAI